MEAAARPWRSLAKSAALAAAATDAFIIGALDFAFRCHLDQRSRLLNRDTTSRVWELQLPAMGHCCRA